MLNNYVLVAVLLVASLMPGCATIVGQSGTPVAISSTPDNARYVVKDRDGSAIMSGVTPAVLALKNGDRYFKPGEYTVELSKPGYRDRLIFIDAKMNNWYWGNFLFGWVLGFFLIDPVTGAMWTLPTSVHSDLPKNPSRVGCC